MICVIDLPREDEISERMSVRMRGWLILPEESRAAFVSLVLKIGAREITRASQLDLRVDVIAAHALPHQLRTGFDFFFDLKDQPAGSTPTAELWVEFINAPSVLVATRRLNLSRTEYTRGHFAPLLAPDETDILHRRHIYTAGPSSPDPSPECVTMIMECLGPGKGRAVLDVGCGVGAYAHPLTAAGWSWSGVDSSPENCAVLAKAGVAHRCCDGRAMPFADGSFDTALCIEVLEHVDQPDAFLAEVARVAKEAVISVPNCELIPYFSRMLAVPWHILESTHVNFFSRWTLEHLLRAHFSDVRIRAYGPAPLRSIEGAPLNYHLLAHVRR